MLTIPVAGVAQHGAGPLGTMRDMMGWFSDARTHYDAHKSDFFGFKHSDLSISPDPRLLQLHLLRDPYNRIR